MAASAAFKSSLRRGDLAEPSAKTKASDKEGKAGSTKKAPLRRSRSVSAFARTESDAFSGFSFKKDNPLFWTCNSPPDLVEAEARNPIENPKFDDSKSVKAAAIRKSDDGRMGRSVSRNSDVRSSVPGNRKEVGRSLSVVDTRRRGRSVSQRPVSRGNFVNSESEVEQEGNLPVSYRNRKNLNAAPSGGKKGNLVRSNSSLSDRTRTSQPKSFGSSYGSPTSLRRLKARNWEDGVSTSSMSETDDLSIKAVSERMESFQDDTLVEGNSIASEIYENVGSEARRAISDIQYDLKSSQERARKLRADLAVEEHRGMELNRILKEVLIEPKTPSVQQSRPGRKSSIERRKISRCLNEEAMAYFDECVSLSTFDSSDFSSQEEPPLNLVGGTNLDADNMSLRHATAGIAATNYSSNSLHDNQENWFRHGQDALDLPTSSSCTDSTSEKVNMNSSNTELSRKFSFSPKPSEISELQQDIKKYVKSFVKDTRNVDCSSRTVRSNGYDLDECNLWASKETLLFDHVFFKNRLESGSLLLCGGGFTIPFSPFASVI